MLSILLPESQNLRAKIKSGLASLPRSTLNLAKLGVLAERVTALDSQVSAGLAYAVSAIELNIGLCR